MSVAEKKRISRVPAVISTLLSVFLMLGTKFLFHACGPMEDGGYMTCHWAEVAVTAVAAVLTVEGALAVFLPGNGVKRGLQIAMIPTAVLAVLLPGTLINLCMMADMQCRAVMRPSVTVLGILIAVFAAVGAAVSGRKQ